MFISISIHFVYIILLQKAICAVWRQHIVLPNIWHSAEVSLCVHFYLQRSFILKDFYEMVPIEIPSKTLPIWVCVEARMSFKPTSTVAEFVALYVS